MDSSTRPHPQELLLMTDGDVDPSKPNVFLISSQAKACCVASVRTKFFSHSLIILCWHGVSSSHHTQDDMSVEEKRLWIVLAHRWTLLNDGMDEDERVCNEKGTLAVNEKEEHRLGKETRLSRCG